MATGPPSHHHLGVLGMELTGPSSPSVSVTVAEPWTGTRCQTRDSSDSVSGAAAGTTPTPRGQRVRSCHRDVGGASYSRRSQAHNVRRGRLGLIFAQIGVVGVGGLVLGIRLDHRPLGRQPPDDVPSVGRSSRTPRFPRPAARAGRQDKLMQLVTNRRRGRHSSTVSHRIAKRHGPIADPSEQRSFGPNNPPSSKRSATARAS